MVSIIVIAKPLFDITYKISKKDCVSDDGNIKEMIWHKWAVFCQLLGSQSITGKNKDLIKYAMGAYLDEQIAASAWHGRYEWMQNSIQLNEFSEMLAGENFYHNIDLILSAEQKDQDIVAIYLLCLMMGYKGKFTTEEGEKENYIKRLKHNFFVNLPVDLNLATKEENPGKKIVVSFRNIIFIFCGLIFIQYLCVVFLNYKEKVYTYQKLIKINERNVNDYYQDRWANK